MEQLLPLGGAVTSIHNPVVPERVADPEVNDQLTPLLVPFFTVAKTRRVEPGITLKPYVGCVMLMDT
jgi:hypothetical protein